MISEIAYAESVPDWNCLADSILSAEDNPNYGILTHYKHTSYRQACINTCKHAWKDYQALGSNEAPRTEKGHRMTYLAFLANRYAPPNASNDPHGLNRNWLSNVEFFYGKCLTQKVMADNEGVK